MSNQLKDMNRIISSRRTVTVTIDPNTGLPKLPEGYFWRVKPLELSIQRKIETTPWTEWIAGTQYPGRFGKQEIETRGFWRKQFRERTHGYSERVFGHRYGESSWYTETIDENPVVPDNLLKRSLAVYNDWQQDEENSKIYGDYPPKKLETA